MTFYNSVKQKEYVLNPKGKPLYEDTNSFASKLMTKMGWTPGKGLGINLDGEQNFIRVTHKPDQKGVGFQDRDDQWTQHEMSFNSLLQSFDPNQNGNCVGGSTGPVKDLCNIESLEEKSKTSRVRVHYKKFTRGKDLSRYSSKDLANIFGKRDLNEPKEVAIESDSYSVSNVEPISKFGVNTIETGTSIDEYFRTKRVAHQNIGSQSVITESVLIESNTEDPPVRKRKKKKNKQENRDEEDIPLVNNGISDEINIATLTDDVIPLETIKLKKKKRKKDQCIGDYKMDSTVEDGVDCEVNIIPLQNDVNHVEKVKLNKKKKSKDSDHKIDCTEVIELEKGTSDSNDNLNSIEKLKIKENSISETIDLTGAKSKSTKQTNRDGNIDTKASGHGCFSNMIISTLNIINQPTNFEQLDPAGNGDPPIHEYKINRYQAEVFRFLDLDGFKNSNFSALTGYGCQENLKLEVLDGKLDDERIGNLWEIALIAKYGADVVKKRKLSKTKFQTLKKKNVFKSIV